MKLLFTIALMWVAFVALPGCQKNKSEAVPEPVAVDADDSFDQPVDAGFDSYQAPEPRPIAPAPEPTVANRSYVVQRGDTLWSIANRQYGDGQRWRDIANANNITDPAKLVIGKTLVLP